jgi:Domain of unknown function (DUF1906)
VALHGLDRAAAPAAAKAKAMLEEINGSWWNVYMGGPRSAGSGWTPDLVRDYQAQGITQFVLTYVGRQVLPHKDIDDSRLLTASQGKRDGEAACKLAASFGYGAGTPICLDLEHSTFAASHERSLNYAGGWCRAVRGRGFRPGVYSNISALVPLEARQDRPDWIWVAKWVRHKVDPNADPHRIPDLANGLFKKAGQRAWQYAATFGGITAKVGGLEVDINVADRGCLAGVAAPRQEELTIVDAATKKYFEEKFKHHNELARDLFRVTDHGDEKPGRSNHHEAIRKEVSDLRTKVNQQLTDLHNKLDQITKALDRIAPPPTRDRTASARTRRGTGRG